MDGENIGKVSKATKQKAGPSLAQDANAVGRDVTMASDNVQTTRRYTADEIAAAKGLIMLKAGEGAKTGGSQGKASPSAAATEQSQSKGDASVAAGASEKGQ